VHSYCVISGNILVVTQCNTVVCEQFYSWHGRPLTYIPGNWSLFPVAHVNVQRCFSLFVIYTKPFNVTLFLLHIQVHWRVSCISEYSQRRQSNLECYWRVTKWWEPFFRLGNLKISDRLVGRQTCAPATIRLTPPQAGIPVESQTTTRSSQPPKDLTSVLTTPKQQSSVFKIDFYFIFQQMLLGIVMDFSNQMLQWF